MTKHLTKEDLWMANKNMKKNAQNHYSRGECKLKPRYDCTLLLSAWLKFKRLTISDKGENLEQLELSQDAGVKWHCYAGNILAVS